MVDEEKKEVVVDEEAVRKVEEEIKAKAAAREAEEKSKIEKLLEESEKKGKEAALKEFEEEQRHRRLEEELSRVSEENKKIREETEKKIADLAKQHTAKIQELESRRKGISKNESPFVSKDTSNPQFTAEQLKQIDEASRRAFEDHHGFRFSAG